MVDFFQRIDTGRSFQSKHMIMSLQKKLKYSLGSWINFNLDQRSSLPSTGRVWVLGLRLMQNSTDMSKDFVSLGFYIAFNFLELGPVNQHHVHQLLHMSSKGGLELSVLCLEMWVL